MVKNHRTKHLSVSPKQSCRGQTDRMQSHIGLGLSVPADWACCALHVQGMSDHGEGVSPTEGQLKSTTVRDELIYRHLASGGAFHF